MTATEILTAAQLAGPLGCAALAAAAAELGTAEQPPGSNRGARVDLYTAGVYHDAPYLVGNRWCARFARWCFESGALNQPRLFAGWGDLGSAYKWREQGKLHRCWAPSPAPGRVGLHLEDSGHGHAVLVVAVAGELVTTIGGNEADAVRVVRRPLAYFTGGFVELG